MKSKITNRIIHGNADGKFSIACIGECMVEFARSPVSQGEESLYTRRFAGDTLNTAVYMSRLLHDQPVSVKYVTSIGNDSLSNAMKRFWEKEHIDCQYVAKTSDALPGLYLVDTDASGERSFRYWRKKSAATMMFSENGLSKEQINKLASECYCIYLSGISLAILDAHGRERLVRLVQMAKAQGAVIVFDSNYRPALWSSPDEARKNHKRILALADMALLTFEDESRLYGDQCTEDTLNRYANIPEVVIRQGASGCLIRTGNREQSVACEKVADVLDTTAAGDAFNAAYLVARMGGADSSVSAVFAHGLAGRVIRHSGAIIPVVSMLSEIKEAYSLWTV